MSIEIRQVTKKFADFKALNDVSLKIDDGELVALLGPSGSGKTTLLRIIGGIEEPDTGEIFIHGEDARSINTANRRVGFVFQHYALFKHMTVFDNVAFGLTVRPKNLRPSKEEIKKKVQELLKLVQLDRMASRYPSELSGGQRQRVALARALAIEPKVLLLDEPFGALDAKVRRDLRQWLRRLHDEIHVTSIFVTHDQEEALEVADRVAVMNEGKIVQIGTPEEVYHKPASPFVFNFLGNVNLFHLRVEEGKVSLGDKAAPSSAEKPIQPTANKTVYVRPHLLEIDFKPSPGVTSIAAKVEYINAAGPIVKVELKSSAGDTIHAEIPHERYNQLKLKKNDAVYVIPKQKNIFNDDYSI